MHEIRLPLFPLTSLRGKSPFSTARRLPFERRVIPVVLAACDENIFVLPQVGGKDILGMTALSSIRIPSYQECVG